jgi:ribosomal protein S4E
VRIVDRRHRYYKYKAAVLDVTQPRVAVLRVENERCSILEGMHERDLETVVPREDNARVMILAGAHAGTCGRVLHRNSKRECLEVHVDEDGSTVTYGFDDVSAMA